MKKILSIAAVSAIATLTLSMGADAKNDCACGFDNYAKIIKNSAQCCHAVIKGEVFTTTGDTVIDELLKDCETIYKDNCNFCENGTNNDTETDIPELPDIDENVQVKPNIPSLPDINLPSDNPSNDGENTVSDYEKQKKEIVDLVNKERSKKGLPALKSTNLALSNAADQRAREQASLFSHTRPDGRKWSTVLSEYSVSYKTAGENVAYGQRTSQEVMNAWMNSSGHRANILSENFDTIGIGVHYKNGTYYWSQLFIR